MKPPLPSNQSFGWTFAGVLALTAVYHPWAMLAALALAIVTMTREQWLTPLNRAWMKIGELLGRVVNPIALGLIFFGLFAPIGFLMRLAGRDTMARRWDATRSSYWLERDPPGPAEDSFTNMF